MRYKFRVWDKIDKVLKDVKLIDFSQWWIGTETEGERHSFNNEETDRYILEQYTGLKDKNGVEICEGDLVKPNYNGFSNITVKYENGAYNIASYLVSECFVVGNIH